MSLAQYNQKRSLKQSLEPVGGMSRSDQLIFVVQKHAATNLHYDFRLEMDGVLKSWAIPKGPSTDPSVKRLAMMVEDHPFDYKDFEGIIPKGNYGAGSVIVWDRGVYEPLEKADSKVEAEKKLLNDLGKGTLKVILHGKKLKGEFALVKLKGKLDNSWLLIKHRDRFASEEDITVKDRSVISGKKIEKLISIADNTKEDLVIKLVPDSGQSKSKSAPPSKKGKTAENRPRARKVKE